MFGGFLQDEQADVACVSKNVRLIVYICHSVDERRFPSVYSLKKPSRFSLYRKRVCAMVCET
jgi:hypothetical protein